MKLSLLQKFILVQSLLQGPARRVSQGEVGGGKIERNLFRKFYNSQKKKAKEIYQESIITKSLEHLIDRELLTGYGKRTPHKWFITHISLTKKGAKISQNLLEERQAKLPLK